MISDDIDHSRGLSADFSLVVLGLGSNTGKSQRIILDAVDVLREHFADLRMASIYETAPMYVKEQNNFLNTAVSFYFHEIADSLSAFKILKTINGIEALFGRDRNREQRWGQRSLDIDILLFGNLVLSEPDLEIPHPRLKERRFALQPLLELLPDAAEPGSGLSYRNICDKLPDQGVKNIPGNSEI